MTPQNGGNVFDRVHLDTVREMQDGEFRFVVASALWEISTKLKNIHKHQQAHANCVLSPRADDILHHLDDFAAERRVKSMSRAAQVAWVGIVGAFVGVLSNIGEILSTIRGWFA